MLSCGTWCVALSLFVGPSLFVGSSLFVGTSLFVGASLFAGGLAGAGSFSIGFLLYPILGLVAFILWILLMVKAYQGQKFRIPIAADLAEKIFGVS